MSRVGECSLLFVNQHYAPDVAATGQCLTDLAEHLASEGYEVEVLASRTGYDAGPIAAPKEEVRNGVRVKRVSTTAFGRGTYVGRIIDYASFYLAVLVKLLFGREYGGVVFLTTPPLIALVGCIARTLRGQRYGIWSMDLHPEAEIAAGMVPERSVLTRVLAWLDGCAYRNADFVVDLGSYMRARVQQKGVAPDRSHTVTIWGGRSDNTPSNGANPLATHLQLQDRFVVMYSGNAGIVHDFGAILEAMRVLRDDPRMFFLFVGDGPRRREVEAFARQEAIENFSYLDYFPRHLLPYSLSVADVHLISLRHEFVGVSVPSKLYGAMAAARPIVFVGPSRCETADAIRAARCGVVIDPADGGDAAAGQRVAGILRSWADPQSGCELLGERGRWAFTQRYDHRLSCAKFANILASAWGEQATHEAPSAPARLRQPHWTPADARRAASDPPAEAY